MLSRGSRSVSRFIPRPLFATRQIRFTSTTSVNSVLDYRENKWIGSNPKLWKNVSNNIQFQKEKLNVKQSGSAFEENGEFRSLIEDAYIHLKQNIDLNKLLYKNYNNINLASQAGFEAFEKFSRDLEDTLVNFKNVQESSLKIEDLVNPTSKTAPIVISHLLAGDKTVEKYFTKKNIKGLSDQAYYIIEQAFHKHLFAYVSLSAPAQKLKVDISNPAEWYPKARKIRRKLILHVGPTNSGKTYHALQKLKKSASGYYAAPLRLLAREVYERFKAENLRCNLVTGEEVIQDLDEYGVSAPVSSGTVEMISTSQKYDVVVLDEIQMIGDSGRGWAWTNALLGAQAKEVHLCGEASAVPLIKQIASMTGDEVIVNEYQRLGKLEVDKRPIRNGFHGLRKGDCIVAFSKKRIWAYKDQIQQNSQLRCGVIYGALPAETRSSEAAKFNNGEYDVLVASDAIGMGLNLKIKRVIFDSHKKFNGQDLQLLESPIVKQIGGRAGRFKVAPSAGSKAGKGKVIKELTEDESIGHVSAFFSDTLSHVKEMMDTPTIELQKAYIWPSDEVWTHYMSEFPARTPFLTVLDAFEKEVQDSKFYRIADTRDRRAMSEVFKNVPGLLIGDQLRIGTAPLGSQLPLFKEVIHAYSDHIAKGFTKTVLDFNELPIKDITKVSSTNNLPNFENLHKYTLLFMWMNNRYPTFFVDRESAVDVKEILESKISIVLKSVQQKRIGRRYERKIAIKTAKANSTV